MRYKLFILFSSKQVIYAQIVKTSLLFASFFYFLLILTVWLRAFFCHFSTSDLL